MKRILYISPDFNYSCGVSKIVSLSLKRFSSNPDYQLHFIYNKGDSLDRLSSIPSLQHKAIPFSKGIKNFIYYKSFFKHVKQYCIHNKIDLIHSFHRFPEYVSSKISSELGLKTVTTALSFVKNFNNISFKSDIIIAGSNAIKKMIEENFNVPPERIKKIYLPAETISETSLEKKKELREKFQIGFESKVLLFIGRINKIKGYDTLLKGFQIVNAKVQNALLLLCGEITDKNFYKFKLGNSVRYIPPGNDNYHLYSIADIIVLPSRIDPFPFVMIESGTCKKPFIGGNTGGIAEFIEEGKNGLLVDPENPFMLADKIIYLLENENIGKELGENLYIKVKEQCDYNNYFTRMEDIYNSLLKDP